MCPRQNNVFVPTATIYICRGNFGTGMFSIILLIFFSTFIREADINVLEAFRAVIFTFITITRLLIRKSVLIFFEVRVLSCKFRLKFGRFFIKNVALPAKGKVTLYIQI